MWQQTHASKTAQIKYGLTRLTKRDFNFDKDSMKGRKRESVALHTTTMDGKRKQKKEERCTQKGGV